jgi:hypothetical protein
MPAGTNDSNAGIDTDPPTLLPLIVGPPTSACSYPL